MTVASNTFPPLKNPNLYRGSDAVDKFWKQMDQEAHFIHSFYFQNAPMRPLFKQQSFDSATTCYICDKHFTPDNIKVGDHCHIISQFRGPSCMNCNLNF